MADVQINPDLPIYEIQQFGMTLDISNSYKFICGAFNRCNKKDACVVFKIINGRKSPLNPHHRGHLPCSIINPLKNLMQSLKL